MFIQTKKKKVVAILSNKLNPNLYRPFIPLIEKSFRRAGITTIEKRISFPGYVFIESHTSVAEFNGVTFRLLYSIKEVYAVLRYGGKDNIAIAEDERLFLSKLLGDNNCIELPSGVIEDGIARVNTGALTGLEHLIKKVNRHRREATIEVNLLGEPKQLVIGLEIIPKS